MEDKQLRDKAVDIKGKQYVLVQDRVVYFNNQFPQGCIQTILLSAPEDSRVVVRADVFPESKDGRCFTGHSQAVVGEGMVNKTAALENAETSAVGRALAFMGIGVIESIASADEMVKAAPKVAAKPTEKPAAPKSIASQREAYHARILELCDELALAPLLTDDDVAAYIKENTGLDFEPEHYLEIGKKLAALKK